MRFHGTPSSYHGGCRCGDCRKAAASYKRGVRGRNRLRAVPHVPHGVNRYQNYGCRCDECVEAAKAERLRRRAAAVGGSNG